VPRRVFPTLRADEVPVLLGHVPDDWRQLFTAALYTGMRKGELFGLRKVDVDLASRTLTVARSHDRDTTKGGHADVIPVAEPLVPVLDAQLRDAPGDLVFPDADGKMRKDEADPQKVLRHALARAGIVVGYDHVCRRCKARHVEPHTCSAPESTRTASSASCATAT
jgi:integrase